MLRTTACGFFTLPSCGEASSGSVGAGARSPRPRACDFRRLRFSRNASLSRSCRGSFFAAPPVWPSHLSLSSVIVNPFDCAALKDITGRMADG